MDDSPRHLRIAATVTIAGLVTFMLNWFCLFIVDGLPRPMRGEAVQAPWPVCLFGAVLLPVVLPWLVSCVFMRRARTRIIFVSLLALFSIMNCMTGYDDVLSKAWRRGL